MSDCCIFDLSSCFNRHWLFVSKLRLWANYVCCRPLTFAYWFSSLNLDMRCRNIRIDMSLRHLSWHVPCRLHGTLRSTLTIFSLTNPCYNPLIVKLFVQWLHFSKICTFNLIKILWFPTLRLFSCSWSIHVWMLSWDLAYDILCLLGLAPSLIWIISWSSWFDIDLQVLWLRPCCSLNQIFSIFRLLDHLFFDLILSSLSFLQDILVARKFLLKVLFHILHTSLDVHLMNDGVTCW